MPTATPPCPEGEQLKKSALQKLDQARALIDGARADMCNLEGAGYSDHWEKAGKLYDDVGAFSRKFHSLRPPTGVFHP